MTDTTLEQPGVGADSKASVDIHGGDAAREKTKALLFGANQRKRGVIASTKGPANAPQKREGALTPSERFQYMLAEERYNQSTGTTPEESAKKKAESSIRTVSIQNLPEGVNGVGRFVGGDVNTYLGRELRVDTNKVTGDGTEVVLYDAIRQASEIRPGEPVFDVSARLGVLETNQTKSGDVRVQLIDSNEGDASVSSLLRSVVEGKRSIFVPKLEDSSYGLKEVDTSEIAVQISGLLDENLPDEDMLEQMIDIVDPRDGGGGGGGKEAHDSILEDKRRYEPLKLTYLGEPIPNSELKIRSERGVDYPIVVPEEFLDIVQADGRTRVIVYKTHETKEEKDPNGKTVRSREEKTRMVGVSYDRDSGKIDTQVMTEMLPSFKRNVDGNLNMRKNSEVNPKYKKVMGGISTGEAEVYPVVKDGEVYRVSMKPVDERRMRELRASIQNARGVLTIDTVGKYLT